MKAIQIYTLSILAMLLFSCDPEEQDPIISNLSVCDTTFTEHNGCDSHHNEILKSADFITAAVTVDNISFESSFQFNISVDGNIIASSPLTPISDVLVAEDLNQNNQIFGYTWISADGEDWIAGDYTMNVTFDIDTNLTTSKNYSIK